MIFMDCLHHMHLTCCNCMLTSGYPGYSLIGMYRFMACLVILIPFSAEGLEHSRFEWTAGMSHHYYFLYNSICFVGFILGILNNLSSSEAGIKAVIITWKWILIYVWLSVDGLLGDMQSIFHWLENSKKLSNIFN